LIALPASLFAITTHRECRAEQEDIKTTQQLISAGVLLGVACKTILSLQGPGFSFLGQGLIDGRAMYTN